MVTCEVFKILAELRSWPLIGLIHLEDPAARFSAVLRGFLTTSLHFVNEVSGAHGVAYILHETYLVLRLALSVEVGDAISLGASRSRDSTVVSYFDSRISLFILLVGESYGVSEHCS
jgi:hypothetical protein